MRSTGPFTRVVALFMTALLAACGTAVPPQEAEADLDKTARDLAARILIVDDDRDLVDLLRIQLSEQYEVVTAQDGLTAMARPRNVFTTFRSRTAARLAATVVHASWSAAPLTSRRQRSVTRSARPY